MVGQVVQGEVWKWGEGGVAELVGDGKTSCGENKVDDDKDDCTAGFPSLLGEFGAFQSLTGGHFHLDFNSRSISVKNKPLKRMLKVSHSDLPDSRTAAAAEILILKICVFCQQGLPLVKFIFLHLKILIKYLSQINILKSTQLQSLSFPFPFHCLCLVRKEAALSKI